MTDQDIKLIIIDLFSGAGGVSTGFENTPGCKVIVAVNHDEMAIASHTANHPDVIHFIEDIKHIQMSKLQKIVADARIKYSNALLVLWASLECTNFSKAKGGLPRNADSRSLADFMPWYIESLHPEYVGIENVMEFMSWGPLDANGKPVSKQQGSDYIRWVNEVKSIGIGYNYDWKQLNAADFGAFTSRKRFFAWFAQKDLPIAWPHPTHTKQPQRTSLFSELKGWKAVREVLDLDDRGESIFTRKKPLSEKTLERIYAGLIKFVAGGKDAFMANYHHSSKADSIDKPNPTLTTKDRHALVSTEFITKFYSGKPEHKNIGTNGPAPSLTTVPHEGLVYLIQYNGKPYNSEYKTTNPMGTICSKDRFGLVKPQFIMRDFTNGGNKQGIDGPAGSIMPNPKMNLVTPDPFIMDTHFNNVGSEIEKPLNTITANRKWPYLINMNSSTAPALDVDGVAPTLTSVRTHYLINPQWFNSYPISIDDPCPTLIARQDKSPLYIAQTESGNAVILVFDTDSPFTIKIKEFMAMYGLVDISMRMLKVPELIKIQGFPANYILKGTQAQQKKYIGNSVVPIVVTKMAEALIQSLDNRLSAIA